MARPGTEPQAGMGAAACLPHPRSPQKPLDPFRDPAREGSSSPSATRGDKREARGSFCKLLLSRVYARSLFANCLLSAGSTAAVNVD